VVMVNPVENFSTVAVMAEAVVIVITEAAAVADLKRKDFNTIKILSEKWLIGFTNQPFSFIVILQLIKKIK
jgi:hypothetical protein